MAFPDLCRSQQADSCCLSLLQVLIQHRAPDEKLHMVERIFASFKSHYVYLSYEEHDLVTANTQAVTHAAFLR